MRLKSARRPSPALVISLISLFFALGGAGIAATGGNFILGQPNTADDTTALTVNTVPSTATCPAPCQALRVTNNSTASHAGGLGVLNKSPVTPAATLQNTGGAPAVNFRVNAGIRPFTVNSAAKIGNLNADLLDGTDSARLWKLGGNAGANPATSFLGTTDAQPLVMKTDDAERMRIGTDGSVRFEGPANPGGTAVSVGGYGDVAVDAPGFVGGRFMVKNGGNVGIGDSTPNAKLQIVSGSTNAGNNTAEFDAPNIGPNASHIHFGTNGDWYIRSAADGGKVILQDNPGNVGIGTTSPSEKLSVNGTVESNSGGFKFPDGSTQPSSAGNGFTTYSNPGLDVRHIADVDDPSPTELAHLDLPAGMYLIMATADFSNSAGYAFQDNSRLVKCSLYDQEFRFKIEPGGGGFFGRSTSTWQSVKNLGSPTTVSLACQAYTGGTNGSDVYGNATRITAIKLASIAVQ